MSPAEITALAELMTKLVPLGVNLVTRTIDNLQANKEFENIVSKIDFDSEYVEKTEAANKALEDVIDGLG